MLTYIEISESSGHGTLTLHRVAVIEDDADLVRIISAESPVQTLTESEALEWYECHGNSWVSV